MFTVSAQVAMTIELCFRHSLIGKLQLWCSKDRHVAGLMALLPCAATVLLARELRPEGFTVVPVTPGWVATDLGNTTADLAGLGGPRPALDAAASVRQMLALLDRLRPDDSGTFFNYDGRRLGW